MLAPLDGKFVEVQGVSSNVEARDCAFNLLGELVDPNGKRGRAHWNTDYGEYAIDTLDGLICYIPEEHLTECDHVGPEDGGHDLTWPASSLARAGTSFAVKVLQTLQEKAYCVIDMPHEEGWFSLMQPGFQWTTQSPELSELFLGPHSNSKMSWLNHGDSDFDLDGMLNKWYQPLVDLSSLLLPWTRDLLGFKASEYHSNTLLRMPIAGSKDRQMILPEELTKDQIESGAVEIFLDFARRRRLCFMYFLHSHEPLELQWKARPSAEPIQLTTNTNRLLVFRHDLLSYIYTPNSGSDIVLQTWLLEEPIQLEIESIQGSQQSFEAILGGPHQAPERQVHVMNAISRFPAAAYRMEGYWAALCKQTDGFLEIPVVRFDVTQYYESGNQFNASGKSSTKHAGMIGDLELISFDNEYFELDGESAGKIPCIQRLLLELSSEIFTLAGFTKHSIAGQSIYTCIADIGIEWDQFQGYSSDPARWLKMAPMQCLSVNRLCHTLALKGPAHQVDTACSASLVASNMAHAYLRKHDNKGIKMSLAMGLQHILSPFPFIGLSAAGMLGSGGRCKTFDQSANGYNRGEGCGGLFCKVSDEITAIQERMACYVGSYVNQDGRSASLTAPNGPSQQLVVRGSLGQAEVKPEWVSATENHGTGTALGDPIEVGTVRAVFRRRDLTLPITSAKTNMGHLEAGAGAVGILRVLCQITNACVPANCHLRQPNAHCETEGFPGMFPVELLDLPTEYHYAGCNGFGFGGTNSRADFFAHRRNSVHNLVEPRRQVCETSTVIGARKSIDPLMPRMDKLDFVTVTCARCSGPMCWLCGLAAPEGKLAKKHHCEDIRADSASYDYCSNCYKGSYLLGGPEMPVPEISATDQTVYMTGTWNAWTSLDQMRLLPSIDDGGQTYEGEAVLGDTRMEQFHLVVKSAGGKRQVIQPVAKRASQRVRVASPSDKEHPGKHWLIDGYREGSQQGTLYKIRLEWAEELLVTWEPAGMASDGWKPSRGVMYRHRYFLVSSLSKWAPALGTNDEVDHSLWRWFMGRMPESGRVELNFIRDEDRTQMIYPADHCPREASVPVCGPDDGGAGRRWTAWGEPGERFFLYLRVHDGSLSLTIETPSIGKMNWRGSTASSYYVQGSWDHSCVHPMTRDEENPEVWRLQFEIGETEHEQFQILVNRNPNLRIYPAGGGVPGEDLACGPDRKGTKKYWQVAGPFDTTVEIVLDLGAEDNCKMVTCRPYSVSHGSSALLDGDVPSYTAR